jgi:uncharacterized membrane protein
MKLGARFVKATVVGGLLFLVPLIVVIVVFEKGVALLRKVVVPLAGHFPYHKIAGVSVTTLLAIMLILILSFLLGLVAQTTHGRRVREWLEWTILGKIPGYTIFKSMLHGSTGLESEGDVAVVLARFEDAWQIAFLVEVHEDGLRTVYVPGVPNPASGSIYYLTADRVRPVGISMHQALALIRRLGVGSKDVLKGKLS